MVNAPERLNQIILRKVEIFAKNIRFFAENVRFCLNLQIFKRNNSWRACCEK